MKQPNQPGQIITFYSYKGGTGRSMALANVACSLAMNTSVPENQRVLAVDWDLEAPGLHRFFADRLLDFHGQTRSRPGLIEIFSQLSKELPPPKETRRSIELALAQKNDRAREEELPQALIRRRFTDKTHRGKKNGRPRAAEEPSPEQDAKLRELLHLDDFTTETAIPGLYLLQAGSFDEKYASRVNSFRWASLYGRAPWLFTWVGNLLAERYNYVLIDSRTGVTDISGICTSILPEKLVTVFTPNVQSLEGVLDLAAKAIAYRRRSDDLRPLMIYPLPSRIEPSMEKLRRFWRFDQHTGYQPRFQNLLRDTYGLSECDLTLYFDEIQVQQVPDYAYGERIAVLDEDSAGDRLSLARSYHAFTNRLKSNFEPWASQTIEYPTVFITYSTKDEEFATVLNSDLAKMGIATWFAPQDLNIADNIPRQIQESIGSRDKILTILSKDAIESEWVAKEIELAFNRERELSRIVLCPITIDSAVLETQQAWASEIRRLRHIGDFRRWRDPEAYQNALKRLFRDLTAETK